jgi:hypothetical protein
VISVVNEMIALAIREWDRVMKRNAFVKRVDLGFCIKGVMMGNGLKGLENGSQNNNSKEK